HERRLVTTVSVVGDLSERLASHRAAAHAVRSQFPVCAVATITPRPSADALASAAAASGAIVKRVASASGGRPPSQRSPQRPVPSDAYMRRAIALVGAMPAARSEAST